MPQYNYDVSARQEIADNMSGCRVDRATAIPTGATVALFNIVGGRVLLTNFVGEVTTIMASSGCTVQISALTTDATAVVTALSSAATDVNADPVGTFYTLPAAVASALTKSTGNSAAYANAQMPIVLKTGALNLIGGASPASGSIKWSAWYVPLDDGAYMAAA
jgi:hypothetical protein